jgi:hypothetical protein
MAALSQPFNTIPSNKKPILTRGIKIAASNFPAAPADLKELCNKK